MHADFSFCISENQRFTSRASQTGSLLITDKVYYKKLFEQ